MDSCRCHEKPFHNVPERTIEPLKREDARIPQGTAAPGTISHSQWEIRPAQYETRIVQTQGLVLCGVRARMIRAEFARTGPTVERSGNAGQQEKLTKILIEIRSGVSQPPSHSKAAIRRRRRCSELGHPKAEPHRCKSTWDTGSCRREHGELDLGLNSLRTNRASNMYMPTN